MSEPDRFSIHSLPDGLLVFDRQLGSTHALSGAAAAIFCRLWSLDCEFSGPASASEGEQLLDQLRFQGLLPSG